MTDQLKTVDEIMEMLREYRISHFDRSNQNAVGAALRAAITDLHTAATRQTDSPIHRLLNDPAEDEAWKDL